MLLGLVFIGLFSVILGMLLFAKWIRSSRGVLKTRGTYISGAVRFILIVLGLVLMAAGMIIPFSL